MTVFWIRATDGLLRKFEFPSDEFKEKFNVVKCSIWAEFKGDAGSDIDAEAFKFDVPQGTRLVKKFLPPRAAGVSPLLGKKPESFTFLDMKGGSVNRESLAGKVVVLDLWATWCGWCFRGFPNLETVYEKFKDNDKVAILAVNTDDPAVSDEKVRKSFEEAHLSIPIVRDQQQMAEKIFNPPGQSMALPTMVVLGMDGSIQYYHLGYDAELAETLPKKIDELLAGAIGRACRQDAREQQEYDKQLADVTIEAAPAESTGTPKSGAPGR